MSVRDHGLEAIRKSTVVIPSSDGSEYCIRITPCEDSIDVNIVGGNVNINGEVTVSGLTIGGRNTTLDVSITAIPLPSVAFTDRNALSIRNLDATQDLYIGFDTGVTATQTNGTTSGWIIGANETFNIDITESIVIYGIVASGSIKVQVQELA